MAGVPQARAQRTPDPTPPCIAPAPLARWQDYKGPVQKVAGALGQRFERTSVYLPADQPGAKVCTLSTGDKFRIFFHTSLDAGAVVGAGFGGALSQWRNDDPSFGQGWGGYGKRVATSYADQTANRFFTGFAYPTLFREDPRYYRMEHGTVGRRLLHAVSHSVIGHKNDGSRTFNFSEWLGTGSAVGLGYAWHPGNDPGFGAGARTIGIDIGQDAGFDILREFWPEIARKLRLPFHEPQ
jgi:hypothetical protein